MVIIYIICNKYIIKCAVLICIYSNLVSLLIVSKGIKVDLLFARCIKFS